jgi:NAD(P)-dependent dehydrogenase (short-subunit alcohol dehydrogenase family)
VELDLAGKSALVTGASLGIGRAIAEELAAEGVNVVLNARDAKRLDEAAGAIARAARGKVVAAAGDMSVAGDVTRVVEAARSAFGSVDILINNAGASPAGRIHDVSDETWLKSLTLKPLGYVRCARAVVPGMRQKRWGRIVNIIGRSGHQPRPWYLVGGAANAALLNFTKALADELAPDNILVNGVNPGPVQTPRWDQHIAQGARTRDESEERVLAQMIATVPLGRVGTPREVSGIVAFLCSERASFITGALINVDGGGTRCI